MTLSDARQHRRPSRRWGRPVPNGPPQMTRITLPACRAHYPGGSRRVLVSVASPSRAAFPESQAGRHPRRHFRGLLRLHSRYGPLDRSTAQRRPLSQGFGAAGYPAEPLASYQTKPTTLWVEPSSTGDARRLGALRNPGFFCNGPSGVNPCRTYPVVGFGLLSAVGASAADPWCPIEIVRPI